MKRAQRKLHFIIWLVLTGLIALVLGLAMLAIAPEPQNDAVPDALLEETG